MMGTLLMALPFPKQRGGTASTRPSSARGVSMPVYPANDRYYGGDGRPNARPLPRTSIQPNYFNPPKGGHNTLQRPTAAVVRPDRIPKGALAGLGKMAARAAPYGALLDFADNLISSAVSSYHRPNGELTGGPTVGFWERRYGPFSYAAPYHRAERGWVKATGNTWHTKITGQSQSGSYYVPFTPKWDWGLNHVGLWIWNGNSSVSRFAHHSSWFRMYTAIGADNVTWAHPAQRPSPVWWDWADPLSRPIGAPASGVSTPYALAPYVGPNPYRSPVEQSTSGYAAPAHPYAPPVVRPPVGGFTWTQAPGQPPRGGIYEPPARPKPPGAKTRERKFMGIGGGNFAGLLAGVGAITESLDLVTAFWKALPKSQKTGYYALHYRDPVTGEVKVYYKRRHKASAADKVRDVLRGWQDIDVPKALSYALDEAIEDRIYGGIGQAAQKARARGYRDVNRDANAQRAGYGKRYRGMVKRKQGEQWVDFGPHGRGYQTGSGYFPT